VAEGQRIEGQNIGVILFIRRYVGDEDTREWVLLDLEKGIESSLRNEHLPQGRHWEVGQIRLGCFKI